ncbi:MAG: asparagine synthetase B [candidate division Zixibacteria bacterium]|nr:asparagine synthetase B [candidate division Zixibacteria bacterium]
MIAMVFLAGNARADKILIPMDDSQTDHLKAYGVAYWCLQQGMKVEWLLNFRAGSFLADARGNIENICLLRGVDYEVVSQDQVSQIEAIIDSENMEIVELEKVPNVAVYTPPNKEPWDDAVTLALTYAEIPYETVWDEDVLAGKLVEYDWLHLHHEDFTGQYGKFYAMYHSATWYQQEVAVNEMTARKLGFSKVPDLKLAVARTIRDYISRGGFLFAMCSAPETLDMGLAAWNTDIVPQEYDGDPYDPNCKEKLDYDQCLCFENFTPSLNALEYRHSDIDTYPERRAYIPGANADYFSLFDFSAKLDPVPTMLVQCHVGTMNGFMGQSTAMRKSLLKKFVTVLAEVEGKDEARYVHGNFGKGTFTFLSGHDPEDYQHMIGDPPTDLSLYKNSPGYRLILNNILFPAARQKERKT